MLHINSEFTFFHLESTQIEDPRKLWRNEQERMLKDYLMVAQDALSTQKELYHVKEQRLALALDEYVRLNDAYKEKSSSRTSCKYLKTLPESEKRSVCVFYVKAFLYSCSCKIRRKISSSIHIMTG